MTLRWRWWLPVVIVVLIFSGWLFTRAGYYLEGAAQDPMPADLLVVLGGDIGERSLKSVKVVHDGFAQRVLLTGIEHSPAAARPAYLNWRAQLLVDHGVPRNAILFDERSGNTMEEAVNTLALMKANGWRSVIVVTDPPHVRRVAWSWDRALKGSGLEFRVVAADSSSWHAGNWWADEKSAQAVILEYIKLAYYLATK